MKKIATILTAFVATVGCVVGATRTVEAQTVYVMTAFDPFDSKQGAAFQRDANDFKALWGRHIENERADGGANRKGYRIYNEETFGAAPGVEWNGPELYRWDDKINGDLPRAYDDIFERMARGIRNCPAGADDAIVVYWSGHGGFEDGEHLLVSQNGTSIRRSKLLDAMKSRGARLVVLLTDSCADYRQTASKIHNMGEFAPSGAPPMEISPLFDKLFFLSSGVVDVNAATENSKAWTVPIKANVWDEKIDLSYGCFTLALCGSLTWKQLGVSTSSLPGIVRGGAKAYVNAATEPITFADAEVGAMNACYNVDVGWSELMEYVQEATRVFAKRFAGQTQQIAVWAIPGRAVETPSDAPSADWSQPDFYPEIGDVVVAVDGKTVGSASAFKSAVASAASTITLTLKDARSGKRYRLRTKLGSGSGDRLGISVVDDSKGARVVGVRAGGPGTRCQFKWE